MKQSGMAFHGSDLEKIEKQYGIPREQIVSFSANVNPFGCSEKAAEELKNHLDVISRYPDREYTRLKEAICAYTGASPEHIVLGNGVTELLSLFIALLQPKCAVIAGPTYSEYEKDLKRRGCQISYIMAREEDRFTLTADQLIAETPNLTDLVILCNPNNPTSGALFGRDLTAVLADFQKRGITLLIDETYVEFSAASDEISAARLTGAYDRLIILRGTSKFFATPGLRLGYAITGSESLLKKVSEAQDPWNINAAADLVGSVMFTDTGYIHRIRERMEQEKAYLCQSLSSIPGVLTYPVNANFVLVKLPADAPSSGALFDLLIRQGMMIRDCVTFPTLGDRFIRICFMRREDNERLVGAIQDALRR